MALEVIGRPFRVFRQVRGQGLPRPDDLMEHSHREGPGTDGRVADLDVRQRPVDPFRVGADGFGEFPRVGLGLAALLIDLQVVFDAEFPTADQKPEVPDGNRRRSAFGHQFHPAVRFGQIPRPEELCLRNAETLVAGPAVQCAVQVADQALPAHVVDDLPGGVEGPLGLAVPHLQEILEDLSQHLRVHGHFLFQGLVFPDGEVVEIEGVEDLAQGLVPDKYVRLLPVVAADRLEEPAVQEGDLAPETAVVGLLAPVRGQGLVEEWLQEVVEEIVVGNEFPVIEPPEKILRSGAPGAEIPLFILADPEPTLLLEEVEEDDLPQELLGKVGRLDILGREVPADPAILLDQAVQFLLEPEEEFLIPLEEFPGD